MTLIDKNIDLNLEIVYEGNNHVVFVNELTNVDNDYLGLQEGILMADKLVNEGLITRYKERLEITRFGIEVQESGGWLKHLVKTDEIADQNKIEEKKLKELEEENLRLQNENLRLQNKQMKRYILYSVIGFILGATLTYLPTIIGWLK